MKPALFTLAAAAIAAVVFLLASGALTTDCGSHCPHEARPTDSFVESLGVNVHLSFTDTPYYAYPQVKAKLGDLGVRHVRDGVKLGRPDVWSRAEDLAKSAGINTLYITGDPLGRHGFPSTVEQALGTVREKTPRSAEALEGPNEYDTSGDANWPRSLQVWTADLWNRSKADAAFARMPLLGPSLSRGESYRHLGDLTSHVDAGNLHPYPGGLPPGRTSRGSLDQTLADAKPAYGSKPLWLTETGYHNAVRCSGCPHLPASERAAGAYVGRMALDHFRRGITRTYLYELVDLAPDPEKDEPEHNFGLYRSDWTPKRAARHIAHLTELLRDPGPAFEPDALRYEVIADGDTEIRQVLMQKRDCSFWLALWQEGSLYDPATRRDLFPSSVPVEIRFGTPVEEVVEYHPSRSAARVATYRGPMIRGMEIPPDDETLLMVRPTTCEGAGR